MLSKERPRLRLGFHAWESPCGLLFRLGSGIGRKWNCVQTHPRVQVASDSEGGCERMGGKRPRRL